MKVKTVYTLLDFMKFLYFCMLLYSAYILSFLEVVIPGMTALLGAAMVGVMLLDMISLNYSFDKILNKPMCIMIFFLIVSGISVLFSPYGTDGGVSISNLVQNIILMFATIYIAVRDNKIDFLMKTFIFVILIGVITALPNIRSMDRFSISESTNSNAFAHNVVCLMVCLPYLFTSNKKFSNFILYALEALLMFTVVMSGSRMSFLCALLFAFLFFIYIKPDMGIQSTQSMRILKIFGGLLIVVLLIFLCYPLYKNTMIAERMLDLLEVIKGEEGDGQGRIWLYETAYKHFKEYPLLGLGYGKFAKVHYGVYTHSTYAELISCVGFIGTIVYLCFYYSLYKPYKNILKQTQSKFIPKLLISLFVILFFMGIGEILFYKINYFILFGILSSYPYLTKDNYQQN